MAITNYTVNMTVIQTEVPDPYPTTNGGQK